MIEVIKFQTPNCGPCKIIQTILDSVAERLQGNSVKFSVVDATKEPDRTQALSVTKAPTVIVFKDGYEVHRFVGSAFKEIDFLEVIQPLL